MAQFNEVGLEGLMLSFREIKEIPDDVAFELLEAGGEVLAAAQKRSVISLGLVDSQKLANSIQVMKRRTAFAYKHNDNDRYTIVHPEGRHHTYRSRVKTKVYKRSKSGRTYTVGGRVVEVTNSEVGFIHEFGAPQKGIPASQWMSKANEACAEETVAAELAVYDRWLKSKDL